MIRMKTHTHAHAHTHTHMHMHAYKHTGERLPASERTLPEPDSVGPKVAFQLVEFAAKKEARHQHQAKVGEQAQPRTHMLER